MCLILLAYRAHPGHPLVVAANRDEFHERPAAPAHWWPDAPGLLAGRDLRGGGTWLGVTRGGRFAAVTNYREPAAWRADACSRGELVRGFLEDSAGAARYLRRLAPRAGEYNGFSLLLGDARELWFYSNRGGAPRRLGPGLYGLSNELLDTPWPKVERGRRRMQRALRAARLSTAPLLAMLGDTEPAADADLPDTGIGRDRERALSPMFIRMPGYGTRCSTALVFDADGRVELEERSFDAAGAQRATVRESFRVEAAAAAGAGGAGG